MTRPDGREESAVHPLFDLSSPATSPLPSDRFTVTDPEQNTGRRVNLPLPPDCVANQSDCNDLSVINQLDGFHQHPRVSIPFDGDIDPKTARGNIFLIEMPEDAGSDETTGASCDDEVEVVEDDATVGRVVGINQVVWDVETRTLHARADEALLEHTGYVLVVTRRVLDSNGSPIGASRAFETYRHDLCAQGDAESVWYRRQLLRAEWTARRAGVPNRDIAAVSRFHTQSATYLLQRLHDAVFAAPAPAPADFNIGPGGSRAIFNFANVTSVTFNRQMTTGTTLSPTNTNLNESRVVPGAIDRIAFGRFVSPDFRAHPGEYIPPIASRTGVPAPTGSETVYINVHLPAGAPPAGGWPVAIVGLGANSHKNFNIGGATPFASARGVAVVYLNAANHGFGLLSTLTIALNNAPSVTIPAGGRSIDQNGDGVIEIAEGFRAASPYSVRDQYDGYAQSAVDIMQLVRVLQAGVDVDGDGAADLDGSRITYLGYSNGSNFGAGAVAVTPEIGAAVFSWIGSPVLEHRRLSPVGRTQVGQMLAARTPSLLNSEYGITEIDGVAMPAPFFNENQPLRGLAPVVNTVPGAIAIQQVYERYAWAGRHADSAAFAPSLAPRPVLIQWGRGDQRGANPTTSQTLRAGGLQARSVFFRFDLFFPTLDPTFRSQAFVREGHWFFQALNPLPLRPLVSAVQDQAAQFLASGGAAIPPITGPLAIYFEQPTASLRDDLGYIR
jgi:hypothetical protein